LGLTGPLLELEEALLSAEFRFEDDAYNEDALRLNNVLDEALESRDGWEKPSADGVHWVKKWRYDQAVLACLGVKLEGASCGSALRDGIVHLRYAIIKGLIDVGVVVVPDDRLQVFLPDRTPSFKDAVRYIEEEFKEAMNYPFVIMAVEHDGPGDALPKQPRKS
jgi:hypothetical protein